MLVYFFHVLSKSGPKSKKKKKRKVDALGKRTRRQKRKEKLGKQIEHLGLILRKVEKDEEKEQSKVEEKKRRKLEEKSATRKLGRHVFEVRSRNKGMFV